MFNGIEFQFCKMKSFWTSLSQECEYTEHYWTVHLNMVKTVNFILCGFFNHNKKGCSTMNMEDQLNEQSQRDSPPPVGTH